MIYFHYPISNMFLKVGADDSLIYEAFFIDEKEAFSFPLLEGERKIHFEGTKFQIAVWKYLTLIPSGKTKSYQDIAKEMGAPNHARAVGGAVSRNKIAYFIPCHRVISHDGTLGGFLWGLEKKKALLKYEGHSLN